MASRPDTLQDVLNAAQLVLEARAQDPRSQASLTRIFDALGEPAVAGSPAGARLPVCEHVASAADPLRFAEPVLRRLILAFLRLEPALTWRWRGGDAPNASPDFAEGHANAMLVGPGGLEPHPDVWIGVSLLAPHVRYPDHSHAPEETYLVMSQGAFSQDNGPWFEPGIGGSFYNPLGILYAMQAGEEPLLAFWAGHAAWRRQPIDN